MPPPEVENFSKIIDTFSTVHFLIVSAPAGFMLLNYQILTHHLAHPSYSVSVEQIKETRYKQRTPHRCFLLDPGSQ